MNKSKHLILVFILVVILVLSSCSKPIQSTITTSLASVTSASPTTANISTKSSITIQSNSTLDVYFIDVGQGDAILLDQGTTEVLIDAGEASPGVTSFLQQYVDGPLEVMVATHAHADHIGGLMAVLNAFEVDQIWHSSDTSTSKTYSTFMAAVNSEGSDIHLGKRGDTITAGTLIFDVLNPASPIGTSNNNSLVIGLEYGNIDFLFTGDAEQEAEVSMLSAGVLSDIDILKVGHHGSRTASSPAFLATIKPELAIYMAGIGNTYGHPHQETLINLDNFGAKIYGTDINGDIKVETDGKTYIMLPERAGIPTVTFTTTNPTAPVITITTSYATTTKTTTTTTNTATSTPAVNVQITKVFYDGLVPSVESDEYVEIANQGSTPVDLKGWVLKDISDGYPSFTFPSYLLQPGKSIRVYTNEVHLEYGGFSFGYGKSIWNNSDPDTAGLFNAQGQEVSRKSY